MKFPPNNSESKDITGILTENSIAFYALLFSIIAICISLYDAVISKKSFLLANTPYVTARPSNELTDGLYYMAFSFVSNNAPCQVDSVIFKAYCPTNHLLHTLKKTDTVILLNDESRNSIMKTNFFINKDDYYRVIEVFYKTIGKNSRRFKYTYKDKMKLGYWLNEYSLIDEI